MHGVVRRYRLRYVDWGRCGGHEKSMTVESKIEIYWETALNSVFYYQV